MFWWDHLSGHMDFYSEDSVSSLCQGVGRPHGHSRAAGAPSRRMAPVDGHRWAECGNSL